MGLICATRMLSAQSSNITIVAVDEFGNSVSGCRVDEFSERSLDVTKPLDNPRDFHLNFVGLRGTGIEGALFWLTVRCDKGYHGNRPVPLFLMKSESFIVLPVTKRIGDDHFGGKPRLTLNVHPPVAGSWVRAINPYEGMDETAAIDPKTGTANLYNISTGRYEIFLLTPGRIVCIYEYDYVEPGTSIALVSDGSCALKK
jgi:hypothetical protein